MELKLTIFLWLLGFAVYSQSPIIDYNSTDGSRYTIINNTLDHSSSGANIVWDFTSLTKSGESTDTYNNATPQESVDYPNTTNVFTSIKNGAAVKFFYSNNGGAFSITGFEGEGLILNYNNSSQGGNALIGNFPLSYTMPITINTDNVAGNFNYIPFSVNGTFTGTVTSEVDAHGTLTVSGTDITSFSGAVTRLKIIQDLNLSLANGKIIQTTYNYYNDSNGDLIFRTSTLEITSFLFNDTSEITESLLEETLGGATKTNNSKITLSIYPNPVRNSLSFNFPDNINIFETKIFDIMGKQILSSKTSLGNTNINTLKSGTYILTVLTSKGVLSRKFIKE